jgi:enoyl-CoA hydratase
VLDSIDLTQDEAWERTNALAVEVFQSGDAIEGSTAFAEKRPPKWGDPPS